MTSRYRLSRSAKRDLQEIADYWVERAGEDAALNVINGIMETIITLSRHPGAGVAAPQLGAAVRKFPSGRYMVYYRQRGSRSVDILHVFHRSRDQRKALKPLVP